MAQVIYGGPTEFNALIYGAEMNPGTMNYLQNSINNISNFSQALTNAGNSFFSNTREIFNDLNGNVAMAKAKAALNKVSNFFNRNDIHYINELSKLQNAPVVMQRFIMAEPTIRKMYHEQRCNGYADTYIDTYKEDIGKNHYDYRRVMTGIVTTDSEGYDMYTTHLDVLVEGDRDLRIDEKSSILKTWEIVAALTKYGDTDPTDVGNGKF